MNLPHLYLAPPLGLTPLEFRGFAILVLAFVVLAVFKTEQ